MPTASEKTEKNENIRSVTNIVDASRQLEGGGFVVNRPFPSQGMALVDPFLLLDEMGPMELGPGEAKGAPDHPHRGFETVTYMMSGRWSTGLARQFRAPGAGRRAMDDGRRRRGAFRDAGGGFRGRAAGCTAFSCG